MSNNNINAQLLMDKMKRVGRSMVDTGSKAILKADIVFLDVKSRVGNNDSVSKSMMPWSF